MATWGATTVKIFYRDYRAPHTTGGEITRINLLPDPADTSAIAQVIQQGPTGRKEISGFFVFDDFTDYQTLEADKIAGTVRTFVGPGETGDDYVIASLGDPDYRQSNAIFAPFVLVEAVDI